MRRSNLLTLRKFFNWKSTWCSKFFYRSLLYKDLFIQFYLNSLFFKLRFNTSSIKLNYLNTNIVICTFDIYINSLRRLKRYNNIFLKKISKMYDYILTYLNLIKNNKIVISNTNSNINTYNLKFFYLNFFFNIFKYNKKSKLIIYKNSINYPFFTNIKFCTIFFNNDIFYSYNNISKFYNLIDLLKETQFFNCIKLEYYYNVINNLNFKDFFFFNFEKTVTFNYNFGLLPYYYLKSKYFLLTDHNYDFTSINPLLSIIFNVVFFLKNYVKSIALFENLAYILFFKNINFFYKYEYKFKKKESNFSILNVQTLPNFKKNITINKLDFYKLKSTFFTYLNPQLIKNFNIIKSLLYFKKINIFKITKIYKFLKKIYNKLNNYDRTQNYLYIYWILKKIWFNLFNRIYISYLYKIIKFRNFLKYKLINLITHFFSIINKYLYLFNFNITYKSSLNFIKNINFLMKLKKFILVLKLDPKKIKKYFKYIYITSYFNSLFLLVEKTLLMYNNKNLKYVLIPNIFLFIKPFISSAKLICDYLYFKLKKKLTINNVYNKIRKWQLAERSAIATSFRIKKKMRYYYINYNKLKKATFQNQLFKNTFFRESLEFRAPLRGIRCVCSGPPYKAKRKLRNFYHIWVANFNLTGWMPLQQFKYQIDYYQTFIVLKRATIGLKVWILLESYVVLK